MLSKDEVAAIVRGRLAKSNGYLSSKLSDERTRVADYMDGKLPAPMHKGNSKYTSNDVFDSVESMKAQLLETFAGAYEKVRFLPNGADDVEKARIDTEVCAFAVNQWNSGFEIMEDVIHDGLTARMGVVKVWWEKSEEETEDSFEGSMDEAAAYLADRPDAEPGDDLEMDPETHSITGTFKTRKDTSRVRIETIPPENFLFSGGARHFEDADLLGHRESKTVSELIAMGYKKSVVEDLPAGDAWVTDSLEAMRRSEGEDPLSHEDDNDQLASRKIEVFETYTKLDIEGKGSARKLYKITMAGNQVLDQEEVRRVPFVGFIALRRPHTIQGENFGKRVIPTQNARTALLRSIIDHAVITTNPRHTVLRNGLMDPRELQENRIGGIVNITKPDAVGVLPQAGLNPFVFQTIGLLDMDREEVTGISKLSQGLNKDAISTQNSQGMVEQLISVSQTRQKVIARRFGEFLKNLYMLVNQLIVENAEQSLSIEVAGNWIKVDPSAMSIRKDVKVDLALGYGEAEKEAQKYVNIDKYLAADPRMGPLYTPDKRHTVLSRSLQAMGVKDVDSILGNPKTTPPPQPDPKAQLEVQKLQADIKLAIAQADAQTQRVQIEAQKLQMEHQVKVAHHEFEMAKLRAQTDLAQQKQDFQEAHDSAELRFAMESTTDTKAEVRT